MNTIYKPNKRYYIILTFIIVCSFLSYEIYIYNYYSIMQMLISVLLMGVAFLYYFYESENSYKLLDTQIKNNKEIIFLFLCMVFITALDNILFDLNNFKSILAVFVMVCCLFPAFYIIPLILNRDKLLLNYVLNLITFMGCFLAGLGIFTYYFPGVLPYGLESGRTNSIYFDSNYLAMVLGIVIMLNINKKKIIRTLFVGLLCFYAIFLTGSRGTMLSIIIAFIIYALLFYQADLVKKMLLIISIIIAVLLILQYLYKINFFRVYQGSNGRLEMIEESIKELLDSPFIGYGYQSISSFLIKEGFNNVSTHNTFVDYAFSFGFFACIVYVMIIAKNYFRGIKNKKDASLMLTLLFMIFNMNTIVYNLGGVGIGSLLFTIFLGLTGIKSNKMGL